ncbi:zinc finger protein RFP-like isoform X4 [Pelodiscus sinensis]|uniref:zinc finger protein RFP-like isoform X4 n=1 Tax=Pelodiscus sinensis TaxID=13735 RepID=UPI003F6D27D4
MASGNLARSFQGEVTCPVCLEYFTDPVSIECGHNFCRACLSRCWGESEPNFCPQCRETIPHRHLQPNYQLGNLMELVKRLQLPAGPVPEGQPECERHQEALKLFCQEDQAPICVVCDRSRAHRAHTVVPIEEAAQECKEQILSRLQRLREKRDALRGLESDWAEESERLLRQTDVERQLVGWECERLRKFLAERERLLLAQLGELDKEIGRRREEHAARLGEDISRLSTMISELEEKCRQPALELLQGVRSAVSRGEEATSPHPAPKCPELERRIRDFPGENSLQGAVTGFLGVLAAERGEDPGCCPRTGHGSCWEPVPPPGATPGLGGRARIGAVRGAQDSGEPEDSQVPRHKAGCWSEVTDSPTEPCSGCCCFCATVPSTAPSPMARPWHLLLPPAPPPNDLVLSLEVPPALGDGSSEWGTLRLRQARLPPPHIRSVQG